MPLANSREVKDEQTNQNCAPAAIAAYHAKPDERISLGMIPSRQGRHLDTPDLPRLTLWKLQDLSIHAQEVRNQFAHLLNRGSSLE